MKRIAIQLVLIFTATYLVAPTSAKAEESASAVVLANTCFSCHGTEGRSVGAMPSIAGKSPEYIAKMLTEFRSDKRKATVMNRIAKGFSDPEIEALAQYFSAK